MYEIQCLDPYGNTINNFTQWDVDQKIIIHVKGCSDDYLNIAPEVHFCNSKMREALLVRSTVSNGDTITASVPNILLQEPYPLLVYVYLTDNNDVSSQKTVLTSEIPIRKRAKPSDYLYIENIERITAEMIKEEIEIDTRAVRDEAINAINDEKNETIRVFEQAETHITNTKNDAETYITNTKNDAETYITNTKNDAHDFIINTKDEAEKSIESTKVAAINAINDEKNETIRVFEQVENHITSIKNDAYDFITNTKDEAAESINNTKNEAEQFISREKAEFETTGHGIIDDAEKIKADTQTIYENTVSVSDNTADKIETDIRTMMLENGMEIKTVNDGTGICTMSIVISQE